MSSKVVLVTGANQGLGFETIHVTALRDPSATYLLGSRNLESGYDSVKRLKDLGVKAEIEVLQLDVTNDEQIEAAVDTVQKKYGKLDGKNNPLFLETRSASCWGFVSSIYTIYIDSIKCS
jgi:NAD(P)-dependent dehydrogenase (short-subunit alcohol dehydrogenase family)